MKLMANRRQVGRSRCYSGDDFDRGAEVIGSHETRNADVLLSPVCIDGPWANRRMFSFLRSAHKKNNRGSREQNAFPY